VGNPTWGEYVESREKQLPLMGLHPGSMKYQGNPMDLKWDLKTKQSGYGGNQLKIK
jgi:hypothetical protein